MISTRLDRFIVILGILFGSYVCYALVMMNDHNLPWWNFAYGILFLTIWLCGWHILHFQIWAWRLSLVLALAGLGLGIYFIHFAWTFWIFKQPTFADRIFAILNPRILVFALPPAIWLGYFLRPAVRSRFK